MNAWTVEDFCTLPVAAQPFRLMELTSSFAARSGRRAGSTPTGSSSLDELQDQKQLLIDEGSLSHLESVGAAHRRIREPAHVPCRDRSPHRADPTRHSGDHPWRRARAAADAPPSATWTS